MDYEHRVHFQVKEGKPYIVIDRVMPDGSRTFCTHHELPHVQNQDEAWALMDKVADWLGHSLLIDSPAFRRYIGIEEGS